MSTLKCKMCGGAIDFEQGATVCTCEYCGTKQTLPRLDDERKANLYDRANHFRRNNEYDKAMSIYEQILNEDNTDAESYWSIVLCKYGIEYVEDPATHKRVPTVNRAQFTSVIADEDYKKALEYADIEQKMIYEEEAKTIDEIQKGILEISKKEDPFDVFICYKETDNDGRRTRDSVLATDLYHQLTQEGFKVFFSRITLEDKLGTAYEPYIFAALNSAKVMVVLGTKPEFFNAVWVKNEWSRYLALIRKGEKKMLIPAYKDMDPYDLPEEFSHLQAQDMGKLGFMQDLIRGIKKILADSKSQAQTVTQNVVNNYSANVTALLKRGNIALEDGEWDRANEFFEEVLNNDAECAEAYWGKFLARRRASSTKAFFDSVIKDTELAESVSLEACSPDTEHIDQMASEYEIKDYLPASQIREMYDYDLSYRSSSYERQKQRTSVLDDINEDRLYVRTKRYISGNLSEVEEGINNLAALLDSQLKQAEEEDAANCNRIKEAYEAFIRATDQKVIDKNRECLEKRESDRQVIYDDGAYYASKNTKSDLEKAIELFESLAGWKDAALRAEECKYSLKKLIEAEENARKDEIYNLAKSLASGDVASKYEAAIEQYRTIEGYRDADEQIELCKQKIGEIKAKEAKKRKRKRNVIIAIVSGVVVAAIATVVVVKVIIPNFKYNKAMELYEAGNYTEAADSFAAMKGYKDSNE